MKVLLLTATGLLVLSTVNIFILASILSTLNSFLLPTTTGFISSRYEPSAQLNVDDILEYRRYLIRSIWTILNSFLLPTTTAFVNSQYLPSAQLSVVDIECIFATKKFLSAEPTGVGRFLLSKYLFLNLTRVNIWLRRKCFIQKL